jgi:hypothetical protein
MEVRHDSLPHRLIGGFAAKPVLLVFLILALLTACQDRPSGTAITNVTVIDAVNGVRENQTVVFDGDEIIAIRSADEAVSAQTIIDATGKYLIPGLWDFHVHLTYDDRFIETMPALFLSYGITSVRDTGGLMQKVLPVVELMRAENAIAPRVFFAGPLLDGRFVVYRVSTSSKFMRWSALMYSRRWLRQPMNWRCRSTRTFRYRCAPASPVRPLTRSNTCEILNWTVPAMRLSFMRHDWKN